MKGQYQPFFDSPSGPTKYWLGQATLKRFVYLMTFTRQFGQPYISMYAHMSYWHWKLQGNMRLVG